MAHVDCHCHIAAPEFNEDVDEVIKEAKKVGIQALVGVTEHFGEFSRMLELSERYPRFVYPCLGVHPVQGSEGKLRSADPLDLQDALAVIEENQHKLLAIGEVGLDFTPHVADSEEKRNQQRDVLCQQLELAKRLNLPVNVHSRSAGRPTIQLLKDQGADRVLLHAFDGRVSVAMEGIRAGYFFSVPPSVVRSEQKQKLVKQLPIEHLLLETDAPALGPEKQVRNEPRNLIISCEHIAKLKGLPTEHVAEVTTQNALRLFSRLKINC
uniref:putative deoxyribonuclease TATDN3 isoform X2 n=1 Tax=Myxine glutinosa TaxID=7769 RepID=UPI00358EFC93